MRHCNPFQAALLAAVFCVSTTAQADIGVGDTFPSLEPAELSPLQGGVLPAIGGDVMLVDFWASWCAPCKASFAALAKLHQEFSPHGLRIVAVGIDERPAAAISFLKRTETPFVVVRDHDRKLVSRVGVPTMPSSYLVDRSGRVRFVHVGFHGQLDEMRRQIGQLLAESAAEGTR